MKKTLSAILLICTLFSLFSCKYMNHPDNTLIKTSNGILGTWDSEYGRSFSVYLDDDGVYHADINGVEKQFSKPEEVPEENEISNITDCTSEEEIIINSSKNKVIEYIKYSLILKDKDTLMSYIKGIDVKIADFSTDSQAEYDYESDSIYINTQNRDFIHEYIIIFNLLSALQCKTNGGKENVKYYGTLFNNSITDILTLELEPEVIFEYESCYFENSLWIYHYLGCVDTRGIKAYFYGYDTVYEIIPEEELDLFALAIKYDDEDTAMIILSNCINDWGIENQ